MRRLAVVLLALVTFVAPVGADSGSGCPMVAFPGTKVHHGPHPGQWFTASYTAGICGPDEVTVEWTVTPEPEIKDVCLGAWDYVATQAAGLKTCRRERGRIFWIGTPGTYTVTASAPDGAGSWTLENVVVD